MSEQNGSSPSNSSLCSNGSNPPCHSTTNSIKVYQAVVFGLPILFTAILLILICIMYQRRRQRQSARTSLRLRAQLFAQRGTTVSPVDGGLCKIFRDALPVIVFDDKFASSNGYNQCPVCLSEFEPNDKLRKLPVCGHCFHIECIDEWIQKNSTCPVCRSTLIKTAKVVPLRASTGQQIGLIQLSGEANSSLMEATEANEARLPQSSGISYPSTATTHGGANALANV